MRKLSILLIALILLVGISSVGFAGTVTATYGGRGVGELKTVTLLNASGTRAQTTLSSTYIIPGKVKILGYSCSTATGSSTENLVALADAASGDTASYVVSENEAQSTSGLDVLFPAGGLNISRGLAVGQGSQTLVVIYYIQVKP